MALVQHPSLMLQNQVWDVPVKRVALEYGQQGAADDERLSSNWRGGWSSRAPLQRARIFSSTLPVPCSGSPCIRIDPRRPHCSMSSILDSRYSHMWCCWLMIVSFSKRCCFRLWFVLTISFTAYVRRLKDGVKMHWSVLAIASSLRDSSKWILKESESNMHLWPSMFEVSWSSAILDDLRSYLLDMDR